MEGLVRFTLAQRVLFNLVFVILMVGGLFAISSVPAERYPEVNFGKAIINASYPGASPQDVEALVTTKIEEALEGLEDIEFIRGNSMRERSTVLVKFVDDSDYEALYDDLRFRVLGVLGELPPEVRPPTFSLIKTSFWLPVVAVNLVGDRSNRALSLMAKELQVPLGRIPGVTEAQIVGEYEREFHVFLDPRKLAAQGLSFEDVATALTNANLAIPAGDYTDASGEFVVRVDERFRTREQVVSTLIRRDADGSFVRVEDLISDAQPGYQDPHVISSVDGQDAVTVKVLKSPQGNALEIYRAVEGILAEHAASLAREGVRALLTQDSTTYIDESMSTLGWNLALGMVLVALILWYFLGIRNAALVTVGVPFAFLATMILMALTGNSLNEITLFSFVLVSGMLVDDAIIVLDNIYRHVEEGTDLEQAIVKGTAEVMLPIIASTATTVAAFLPMLIMTGATGEFFALIPKAVTFALLASLFECLLILPLHYLDFGPRRQSRNRADGERAIRASSERLSVQTVPEGDDPQGRGSPARGRMPEGDVPLLRVLRRITRTLIPVVLRHRWLSLGLVWVAFCAAIAILGVSIAGVAPLVRIKFFPDDYNRYYVFVEGPANTALNVTDARVKEIARAIMADGPGHARSASSFAGFVVSEDYEEEYGHNLGTVMVDLPRKKDRAFDDPAALLELMRDRLTRTYADNGLKIRLRAEKDGPPTGKDINIQVVGTDDAAVQALSAAMLADLSGDPGLGPYLLDLKDNRGLPTRVLRLAVDAERARELGLTQGDAARLAAAVLDGRYLGKYRLSDEEIDLKLRIDPEYLDDPEAALQIPALERPTGPVLLGDIVRPVAEIEPGELKRYRGNRSITIAGNIRPGAPISSAQVAAWAKARYAAIRDRYPGAGLVFGGEYEDTQRSFDSLTKAFGLAVLIIYLILATQFRSYVQPLIVLSAVMFAVIGIVFGKLLTQTLFTVNSFIAVVGVTGVVVNDSLVLLDFMNRAYRSGLSRFEAIHEGVRTRLRPILLTTLTTVLGLLPMALGIPSYSLVWGAMASTFVTGLASATFLTLFLVPVAWDLLMEREERRAGQRLGKTKDLESERRR